MFVLVSFLFNFCYIDYPITIDAYQWISLDFVKQIRTFDESYLYKY